MGKTKEIADQTEPEMPRPAVDERTEEPHKQDTPPHATGIQALSKAPDKHVAKAEKARTVAALQREIGNARVAKALAKPEAATIEAQPKTEADRGATKAVDFEAKERILHH